MAADPLTNDRYTFGGGNPVNTIEFDGRIATTTDQHARHVQTHGGDVIDREQGRTVSGPNTAPGRPDRSGYVDRDDPGASSSPYLARQIVSSPAAEPVLGELSFDRLKRGKVTHLIFLLDQVEREEGPMRAAASEGGGLGFEDLFRSSACSLPLPARLPPPHAGGRWGSRTGRRRRWQGNRRNRSQSPRLDRQDTPPQRCQGKNSAPDGWRSTCSERDFETGRHAHWNRYREGQTAQGRDGRGRRAPPQVGLGGRDITPPGHPGVLFELPGRGGYVGLRPYSKSGPPTVDVNVPGLSIREIKFTNGL